MQQVICLCNARESVCRSGRELSINSTIMGKAIAYQENPMNFIIEECNIKRT
ncbi:hypothetical protein H6F98_03480 [Microcoleus sp. FACHB-SPT15]|uniref:hypothetical protein n=1 Tax=Microcoleus sp. FACHB-SPT15 TaxID=2692830 RepID=UPI001784378A|nr:hypothetical protein [Microcoleus sp. FACHB-SPT15]MBD1804535.1 hypothetical protein [Microcoleus sp. FACHB-SPT15]